MKTLVSPSRLAAILAVLALGGFITLALRPESSSTPSTSAEPPTEVVAEQPIRRDLSRTITLPGNIRPYQEAKVFAKVSGYLEDITVDRGDWVEKGRAIARLEIPEMQRRYRRAETDTEMKRKIYRRYAGIRQKNRDLIALERVEEARTAYEMAKAERDELAELMNYATIHAPFDGVVTARHLHPGALVQAGTESQAEAVPLVHIAELDRLRVTVAVPESDVAWISKETQASMSVDARPDASYVGKVTRFANALDPDTRTMATEVHVKNPGHTLYPGMYAHVTLTLETREDRLTIPHQAILEDSQGRKVLVARDGVVRAIPIETGYEDAELAEVTSGLSGDEHVIVEGHHLVDPGDRVTTRAADKQLP